MDKPSEKEMQIRLDAIKKVFPEAFTRPDPNLDVLLEKMEDVLAHLGKDYKSDKALFAWDGKGKARELLKAPFAGTLYLAEEDQHYQPYGHIFIEGESLEVLKIFARSYSDQIDMVYVDPPSPLNHDFVLLDDPEDLLGPYLKLTGVVEGNPEIAWPLEAGKRHQRWLNFLYPRLMLAHEMLADHGLLFMHTSPDEQPFVRFLLDSIFGIKKYLTTILWQKKSEAPLGRGSYECILVYCKNTMEHWPKVIPYLTSIEEPFSNPDNDPRGDWTPVPIFDKTFPVLGGIFGHQRGNDARKSPSGKEISPPEGQSWLLSEDEMDELTAEGRLYWGTKKDQMPVLKYYKSAGHQFLFPTSLWTPDEVDSLRDAHADLKQAVPDLRECLKTSQIGQGRANLQDDQTQTSLPDRSE